MRGRRRCLRQPRRSLNDWMRTVLLSMVFLRAIDDILAQPYKQQRCSNRLENALEQMRRRSFQTKSSRRSWTEQTETPYSIYHSLYGHNGNSDDDFYNGDGGGIGRGDYAKNLHSSTGRPIYPSGGLDAFVPEATSQRQPHKLVVSRVEVEELRVRLPQQKTSARWVEVDKCKFSTENSTLDTRLIFPDLTISGKVVLQPTGGTCNMILRLRHAGIEFRTVPIGFDGSTNDEEQSRRLGLASVRTDSHFAEPGFISVFAHGCQGPGGIRLRQNSKRRYGFASEQPAPPPPPPAPEIELSEPHVILGTRNANRWGKFHNPQNPNYDIRSGSYKQQEPLPRERNRNVHNGNNFGSSEQYNVRQDNFYRRHYRYRREARIHQHDTTRNDEMNFNDDILNVSDDLEDLIQPDARAFAGIFGNTGETGGLFATGGDRDEVGDALSSELEKLFSMGVRGLLTTYMRRALQPAIKETLMENMGYTLSYG